MTKRARKALIIGAGIAGPVTAMLLKRAGIDAQLFEAWPYSTGIGGGLQIAPNGMHVLAEIGLADEMIRCGSIAESFDFLSQARRLVGFGGFLPRSLIENPSIGQRVETTFGQSGFFGYGFCSPDPQDGVMWWSTQPSHGTDAATLRAMSQDALKQQLLDFHAGLARSDPATAGSG